MTLPNTPNLELRLVLDTGFLIAAALKRGFAYDFLFEQSGVSLLQYKLFSSSSILSELQEKLETKFFFDREIVLTYITNLSKVMTVVLPRQRLYVVRDPDDNKVLECAVAAQADVIVSADKDLLSLKEFQSIKIVHPSSLKYLFSHPRH